MTSDQLKAAQAIISGLHYLLHEADHHKLHRVSKVLHASIKDICTCLEHDCEDDSAPFALYDTDLFMAIKFLSRFASIRDEDLKREIMDQIQKMNRGVPYREKPNAA